MIKTCSIILWYFYDDKNYNKTHKSWKKTEFILALLVLRIFLRTRYENYIILSRLYFLV